jgi:hypothetical protein
MSWSANAKKGDTFNAAVSREEVEEALRAGFSPQQGYGEEESKRDFEIALAKVKDIVTDIAATAPEGALYRVSANGHANPNRTPEGGWATDAIALRVELERASES